MPLQVITTPNWRYWALVLLTGGMFLDKSVRVLLMPWVFDDLYEDAQKK